MENRSPKTREFTRSTICRVHVRSAATLREGRGLSLCLVSVKTVIISFIHRVAHIASPQPEKYRVYRSHTRLYVDFSWDSVERKKLHRFWCERTFTRVVAHLAGEGAWLISVAPWKTVQTLLMHVNIHTNT